jgi:hypothetical protein
MVSTALLSPSYLMQGETVDQATTLLLFLKPAFVPSSMPAGFELVSWPSPSYDLLVSTKSTRTRCSMVWANQAAVFHIALDVFVKLPEPVTPICFQHCHLCSPSSLPRTTTT